MPERRRARSPRPPQRPCMKMNFHSHGGHVKAPAASLSVLVYLPTLKPWLSKQRNTQSFRNSKFDLGLQFH